MIDRSGYAGKGKRNGGGKRYMGLKARSAIWFKIKKYLKSLRWR